MGTGTAQCKDHEPRQHRALPIADSPTSREAGVGPGVVACTPTPAARRSGARHGAPRVQVPRSSRRISTVRATAAEWSSDRVIALADEIALLQPVLAAAVRRWCFVGHSYGAAVALLAALAERPRLAALVLLRADRVRPHRRRRRAAERCRWHPQRCRRCRTRARCRRPGRCGALLHRLLGAAGNGSDARAPQADHGSVDRERRAAGGMRCSAKRLRSTRSPRSTSRCWPSREAARRLPRAA